MVPTGTTYTGIDYTKYVNGYAMKNEHIKIILLFNSPKKGTGADPKYRLRLRSNLK